MKDEASRNESNMSRSNTDMAAKVDADTHPTVLDHIHVTDVAA